MLRRALLLLVVGPALAAPVPKDFRKPDYFPTAVGSRWEYVRDGETEVAFGMEVESVAAEKDGSATVVFKQTHGPKWAEYPAVYRVGADGVFILKIGDRTYDPPRKELPGAIRANAAWRHCGKLGGSDATTDMAIGEEEPVAVPAGKFRAFPLSQTYTEHAPPAVFVNWYAAGVGSIRLKDNAGVVYSLSKFTPGKEPKK